MRDYGTAKWQGGDEGCDHLPPNQPGPNAVVGNTTSLLGRTPYKNVCGKCGAIRIDAQIGLEQTPDEYIANLVEVFRECKRVLRDDGTMFVVVGDSYFSGGQRAAAYDIFDKELASFPDDDLILKSLCGECRRDYQSHISRNDSPLVAMLATSTLSSIHAHKEFESDHFPTLDSCRQASQIEVASQDDFALDQSFFAEQLRAFLVSKIGVSSQQLLDEWMQRGNSFLCLSCGRSLVGCDLESAHKLHRDLQEQSPHIRDSALHGDQQAHHNQCRDKDGEYCKEIVSYQNYTTKYLKPKDLIGIPWMLAFALRADGWYLRQDIIWHKPNPMPESVKDRCTKSHEYIFLLSKSARYYYDNEAVKEPAKNDSGWAKQAEKGKRHQDHKAGSIYLDNREECQYGLLTAKITPDRNKRDVWTISTKPYKGAHYATYPPDLITPCILAGAPAGGIVFDPFVGSGTTVATAIKLGRKGIGIDLNIKYLTENARQRIADAQKQPRLI